MFSRLVLAVSAAEAVTPTKAGAGKRRHARRMRGTGLAGIGRPIGMRLKGPTWGDGLHCVIVRTPYFFLSFSPHLQSHSAFLQAEQMTASYSNLAVMNLVEGFSLNWTTSR